VKIKPLEEWFVWKALVKLQRCIVGVAVLTILVTMTTCVVLRYIIGQDIVGSDEICTIAAMWLYFIGSSLGSYEDSHIKANILDTLVKSDKFVYCLQIVKLSIALFVLIYFTIWATQYWQWNVEAAQVTAYFRWPLMTSKAAVTIGFYGMTFYTIWRLVRQFMGLPKALKGVEA